MRGLFYSYWGRGCRSVWIRCVCGEVTRLRSIAYKRDIYSIWTPILYVLVCFTVFLYFKLFLIETNNLTIFGGINNFLPNSVGKKTLHPG